MTRMRLLGLWLMLSVLAVVPARAAEPPSLARARALYNAADYDGAILAAAVAQRVPTATDAATLVIARAHIERYRRSADPADLASARGALGSVRAAALTARDQVDLLVGLGQSLFFSEIFGAAAELFDTALGRAELLPARDHMLLLDWWASALDREAQSRPAERRAPLFERMIERTEAALRLDPGNAAANYWLVAAIRGSGDPDRAWEAAIAAWVRSTLSPASAETLRADLDRLMTQALIPERARTRRDQPDAAATLRAEWDLFKSQWK